MSGRLTDCLVLTLGEREGGGEGGREGVREGGREEDDIWGLVRSVMEVRR